MSSYLHRIASRVLNSQSAIHPFVGTLWASPRSDEPQDSTAEISTRTASSHTEQIPTPTSAQLMRSESIHTHETHSENLVQHAPTPARAQENTPPAKPLAPLLPQHSHSTHENYRSADTVEESISTVQKERPQPLIVPFAADSSQLLKESLAASTRVPATTQANPLRRQQLQASPVHEPDEIEIHIGRIDVIAAQPQPAPRVQPQASRKSLDLGEYLRRGRAQ